MRSTRTRRPLLTPDQAFEERAIRRDGHEELPAGPKARRTRATILEAALVRFEADGYLRTSMNVSHLPPVSVSGPSTSTSMTGPTSSPPFSRKQSRRCLGEPTPRGGLRRGEPGSTG
jgi:hypothetical protein